MNCSQSPTVKTCFGGLCFANHWMGGNMRKFLFVVFTFVIFGVHADTITLKWMNENGTTAQTTTCETGGNINLLSAPSKPGYTFTGWKIPPYIPIEYIENERSRSYIRSDVIADLDTKIIFDYAPVEVQWNAPDCRVIYGGSQFKVNNDNGGKTQYAFETVQFFFATNNTSVNAGRSRRLIIIGKEGIYLNGVKVFEVDQSQNFKTDFLTFLQGNLCILRLYSLQIYQNNILVHDYVPALDANNVVSLYDKVDGAFLYNAGTGELVGGPIIDYE